MDVQIRAAQQSDIPAMARLWHEKMTVLQQSDRRYRLAPDAIQQWSAALEAQLNDSGTVVYVGAAADVVGYIIATMRLAPPGLLPDIEGVVVDMAVGIHSGHSGLGRRLLEPVQQWFAEQGLTRMMVQVPRQSPVEQAFWRALGAVDSVDVLWTRL